MCELSVDIISLKKVFSFLILQYLILFPEISVFFQINVRSLECWIFSFLALLAVVVKTFNSCFRKNQNQSAMSDEQLDGLPVMCPS